MTFEDDLRATMRAHDHEAPSEATFTPPPAPRHRVLWPALAAAAVVLVVAGAVAVTTRHEDAPSASPPPCLDTIRTSGAPAQLVPAPSQLADRGSRLVPTAVPRAAVVCRYLNGRESGRRTLSGLANIPRSLSYLPVARAGSVCSGFDRNASSAPLSAPRKFAYAVGLRYGNGTHWVVPQTGRCGATTNGNFSSGFNIIESVTAAFDSGRWPGDSEDVGCATAATGRLGDDTTLAPAGATSIDVCAGNRTLRTVRGPQFKALLTALADLHSAPTYLPCPRPPSGSGTLATTLRVRYPAGPSVELRISSVCPLFVTNDVYARGATAGQLAAIARLTG